MWKPGQYRGVIRLIQDLQARGIRVDGVGIQGHWALDSPSHAEIENLLQALSVLGVKLMITELDICVIPFADNYDNMFHISSLDLEAQNRFL